MKGGLVSSGKRTCEKPSRVLETSNLKSQISNLYFNTVKNSSGFLLHMKYKLHNNI